MNLREQLILSHVKGIGIKTLRKLVALQAEFSDLKTGKLPHPIVSKLPIKTALKACLNNPPLLERIDKTLENTQVISYWENAYPEKLKCLNDAPNFLFCNGDINLFKHPSLGIVGTRAVSKYGKYATYLFANTLSASHVIISGLARGVDTIAHQTVVQSKQKTIAVLGNGLDVIYPSENKNLYQEISSSGLVISEHINGTPPDASNFPKRNRMIAGLSDALLVIEAGKKSGSLITAEIALDLGKDVFAIPGPINSKQSDGTNGLLKDGAFLAQTPEDIRSRLGSSPNKQSLQQFSLFDLTDPEKVIVEKLSGSPKYIDELCTELHCGPHQISTELLMLEMNGYIKDVGGKHYVSMSAFK